MLYYTWCIKDREGNIKKELKLRLTSRTAIELENKIGENPFNELIISMANSKIPTTRFIAENLKAGLQKLEHGYDESKVFDLIDEYIECGGSIMEIVHVIFEMYKVSGFFVPTENQKEEKEAEKE
jgi:hypothetical protein